MFGQRASSQIVLRLAPWISFFTSKYLPFADGARTFIHSGRRGRSATGSDPCIYSSLEAQGLHAARRGCPLDERGVAAAAREELVVAPALDDAPAVEDDDLVRVVHGREPVGGRDRRAPGGETVERLLHLPLRLRVERARRLVEDEDRRISQDRGRDRDPLFLATGEAVAALADDRVVALGQRRDHVMDARRLGGRLDLLVGRVRFRKAQVLANRLDR